MSYKKHEHMSHKRLNEFEHAKIIAIVDNDGKIIGYDYTLTRKANDFFADPEDRKKYQAITVKPVACESMSELKEKFRVAEEFLRFGATLAAEKAQKSMKSIVWGRGSTEWMWHVDDNGMIHDGHIGLLNFRKLHCFKPSPQAHGIKVSRPHLQVVDEKTVSELKVDDRVQLCIINRRKVTQVEDGDLTFHKLPPLTVWATVVSKHTEMWVHVKGRDKHFFQHHLVGQIDDGTLIEFNPKHVIQQEQPVESESESESDESDCDIDGCDGCVDEPVLEDFLEKMTKIKSELCDRPEPETALEPEPSDEEAPEQQPEPEEDILPVAPPLRRRSDLPGWKSRR